MPSNSEAECHPYAMLDRCQSRRVASVPIGDNLQVLMARKTEAPPYEDLINFPRAKDKDEIRCVMCGFPPGMTCAIPRQNKDVCKECDKSTWVHGVSNVYFKWCKGCKKFLRLGCFSEKLDAAKCDRCRERGRQSYLLKKGKDGCSTRSRSNSITSMKSSDFEAELSDNILSVAAAIASCNSSSVISQQRVSSRSEISSEEDDFRDPSGSDDGEYDYPQPLSPREIIGDYNDTIMSAHAVVSFSKFRDQSNYSPFINQNDSTESDQPVLIDDTTADVTKSKLSSVFGKPLCELKRMPSSSSKTTHLVAAESGDEHGENSDESPDDGTSTEQNKAQQVVVQQQASGPVCTSLRGTLYELACIHERIMTLEEHASRVKCLEATIKEQQVEIESLRSDADSLREELKTSKRLHESDEEVVTSSNGATMMDEVDHHSEVTDTQEAQTLCKKKESRGYDGMKRNVASDLAMILDDPNALEVLADVMDRVQKRPRLVSMGE